MKYYFADNCLQQNVVLFGSKVTAKVISNRDRQPKILHKNNISTIGGHMVENKTYNKVKEHFYLPDLQSDVKELALFLYFYSNIVTFQIVIAQMTMTIS